MIPYMLIIQEEPGLIQQTVEFFKTFNEVKHRIDDLKHNIPSLRTEVYEYNFRHRYYDKMVAYQVITKRGGIKTYGMD